MTVDYIRYDILTQDALRSVVRTVLVDAATKGLPGDHHFLVSFDTRADGVVLSSRLRAQYPKEMTIVLQHQFWDMIVTDDRFEVGLSFSGVPERLVIPFRAIRGFADPSVQFGLQFSAATDESEPDEGTDTAPADAAAGRPSARHERPLSVPSEPAAVPANPAPATAKSAKADKAGKSAEKAAADKPAKSSKKSADKASDERPSGEVVRLDRFRKK